MWREELAPQNRRKIHQEQDIYYFIVVTSVLWSCILTAVMADHGVCTDETCHIRQDIPSPLIVGYANWNQCDEGIVGAVKDGVNVVIWFSINLALDPNSGLPAVQGGPDMDCVGGIVKRLKELNLPVIHLMSIGGWNSPHPDISIPALAAYACLNKWNREVAARPEFGFHGFDGFDWDIEGNDDFDSPYNSFSVQCLDLMGEISQLAKKSGYIFAMAPAESYLDPSFSSFDRSLTHSYQEWDPIHPGFNYHGRNTYAYLLAKFGRTLLSSGDGIDDVEVDTFDFITIQLYEGFSHAEYRMSILNESPVEFIPNLVKALDNGWLVNFESDPMLNFPSQEVCVPAPRLVIGLANGWAGDGKFLFIPPGVLKLVHAALVSAGLAPRGYAFWNIKDEGIASPREPGSSVFLARGLNDFLHVRVK